MRRIVRAAAPVLFLSTLLFFNAGCAQRGPNHPPVVELVTGARSVFSDESFTVFANAYDEDGDTIHYRWGINGLAVQGVDAKRVDIAILSTRDDLKTVQVDVDDGNGGTSSAQVQIKVTTSGSLRIINESGYGMESLVVYPQNLGAPPTAGNILRDVAGKSQPVHIFDLPPGLWNVSATLLSGQVYSAQGVAVDYGAPGVLYINKDSIKVGDPKKGNTPAPSSLIEDASNGIAIAWRPSAELKQLGLMAQARMEFEHAIDSQGLFWDRRDAGMLRWVEKHDWKLFQAIQQAAESVESSDDNESDAKSSEERLELLSSIPYKYPNGQ